jgi:Leucine-rich repeat (LRR) protein
MTPTNPNIFAKYHFIWFLLLLFLLPTELWSQKPVRITQNGEFYDIVYKLAFSRKIDKQYLMQLGGKQIDSVFFVKMDYESFREIRIEDSIEIIITYKPQEPILENTSLYNKPEQENTPDWGYAVEVFFDIPTSPSENITILDLDMPDTTKFYQNLANMQSVQSLTLDYSEGIIPSSVGELENLETLQIGEHKNSVLPASIGKLKHLKTLTIGKGELSAIPVGISQLDSLLEIYINENAAIESLPIELGALQNLEVADFSLNGLKSVPAEIYKCKNLKILQLAGNQITSLPEGISQLENLEELYLDQNLIDSLPADIVELKNLKKLSLTANQLKSLPQNFGKLTKIEVLNLNDNKISVIPDDINLLIDLRILQLQNNRLEVVPENIAKLDRLEELYLSNNRIKALPQEMTKMASLQTLTITGNIIKEVPQFPQKIKIGGDY